MYGALRIFTILTILWLLSRSWRTLVIVLVVVVFVLVALIVAIIIVACLGWVVVCGIAIVVATGERYRQQGSLPASLTPELTLRRNIRRHRVVEHTTGFGRSNPVAAHPDSTHLPHELGDCSRRRNGPLGDDPTS